MSDYAYVGRCKCNHIVAAILDRPERKREVAKEVATMIKEGLTVERVDSEVVRVQFHRCTCTDDNGQLPMFSMEAES